jgi:hypothetical protein
MNFRSITIGKFDNLYQITCLDNDGSLAHVWTTPNIAAVHALIPLWMDQGLSEDKIEKQLEEIL